MNKPIFLAIILAVALTGCLHHKKKNEKHLKSKEKKDREAIKVVEIPLPKKEEKEPENRQEVINTPAEIPQNPAEDKKKPETSWWSWD